MMALIVSLVVVTVAVHVLPMAPVLAAKRTIILTPPRLVFSVLTKHTVQMPTPSLLA